MQCKKEWSQETSGPIRSSCNPAVTIGWELKWENHEKIAVVHKDSCKILQCRISKLLGVWGITLHFFLSFKRWSVELKMFSTAKSTPAFIHNWVMLLYETKPVRPGTMVWRGQGDCSCHNPGGFTTKLGFPWQPVREHEKHFPLV